jgi:hypothetical protein
MNEIEKNIYIRQRAIQIKQRQDKVNGHLFVNPYPIEDAMKIAENQLNCDLKRGQLRITLDELLLLDDDTCNEIISRDRMKIAQKLIKSNNKI